MDDKLFHLKHHLNFLRTLEKKKETPRHQVNFHYLRNRKLVATS